MRCRKGKGLLLALAMCAAFSAPAFGFNHYKIDVDALKELTATDTFELKITKKTVADDVNSSFSEPNDMLTLTLENTSGKKVESLKVMIVCYDAQNAAASLESAGLVSSIGTGSEKRKFALKEFSVDNGQSGTFQVSMPCTHDNFTGASTLVASYTAEGEEVVNPLAEEWNELALGSPTHILD